MMTYHAPDHRSERPPLWLRLIAPPVMVAAHMLNRAGFALIVAMSVLAAIFIGLGGR